MDPACFALLDDATPGAHTRSRLYTGHLRTLRCDTPEGWPGLLADMQQALDAGLYAVPLLTYELGCAIVGTPAHAAPIPLARVLLFSRCERLSPDAVAQWLEQRSAGAAGIAEVRASVDETAFTEALDRIHDYIEAGDTYQVNYTYRLRFDAFGSLPALYARLRARQPVPYGALIALPDGSGILSLSPELFVRQQDGVLTAQPMKGTAPASDDDGENTRRAADLAADPKNRAENLMIVDLLRNDLGRVCDTGSVSVPALFEVTRYSRVLQMTSTVSGRLRAGATLGDIFDALYPCGSITGAPKRRTMEIIHEVETTPRGIYTGAIGWFDPPASAGSTGDFCMSVPIRTLALSAPDHGVRHGEMGVGAGIVYDSQPPDEYAECQLKARFLTGMSNDFELFETMYATADGCRHVDLHLDRIARSAACFGFVFHRAAARQRLDAACSQLNGPARVRLSLRQDGSLDIQAAPLAPLAEPVKLFIAQDTVDSDDLFLRHKTSVRVRYDAAWREAEANGGFDMIFFNERGELAEGARSNVFVKLDGRWYTPPLSAGALPGVMRAVLLAAPEWNASERVITRDMLERAEDIIACNSLRGPLKAVLDIGTRQDR